MEKSQSDLVAVQSQLETSQPPIEGEYFTKTEVQFAEKLVEMGWDRGAAHDVSVGISIG